MPSRLGGMNCRPVRSARNRACASACASGVRSVTPSSVKDWRAKGGGFNGSGCVGHAFSPETMSEPFLGGVNVAVVYGLWLIVVPLLLALIYTKLCRKPPNRDPDS